MGSLLDDPEYSARLFFPQRVASPPPAGAQDVQVPVAPGVEIHVRCYDVAAARPPLVLFHGNGEVVADYDALAPRFAACGVALAAVEYRGYGRSGGAPSLRACLSDARPALEAVRARYRCDAAAAPLVLGRSLGSLCAAELARRDPSAARGFVFDSAMSDLDAHVRRRGYAPEELSAEDRATFDPLPKYRAARVPLLALHGADDTLIGADEARALHAAWGCADKRLELLPGRGHNDLSLDPRYWDALAAFVAAVTR